MIALAVSVASVGLWLYQAEAPAPTESAPTPPDAALVTRIAEWLRARGKNPEEYVLSKFADHDIVLLGEWHRIRHDPLFVQTLIRRLPEVGVLDVGIEFGAEELQAEADRLVTAPQYDEALARRLMFREDSFWGYREYIDLYRAAWEVNQKLPADGPRFRIVHLNYLQRWSLAEQPMNHANWEKVWFRGSSDEFMAGVAKREFIDRHRKALIYCGLHHAFTRYKQPESDEKDTRALRFMDLRTGNILRALLADRVCTIGLHAPWRRRGGGWAAPLGGVLDRAVAESGMSRVGFDVFETPAGELADPDTYYSVGYSDFRFGHFVDGWVWLTPFERYEGCTVDEQFITAENLEEARQSQSPAVRDQLQTVEQFMAEIRAAADVPKKLQSMKQ